MNFVAEDRTQVEATPRGSRPDRKTTERSTSAAEHGRHLTVPIPSATAHFDINLDFSSETTRRRPGSELYPGSRSAALSEWLGQASFRALRKGSLSVVEALVTRPICSVTTARPKAGSRFRPDDFEARAYHRALGRGPLSNAGVATTPVTSRFGWKPPAPFGFSIDFGYRDRAPGDGIISGQSQNMPKPRHGSGGLQAPTTSETDYES